MLNNNNKGDFPLSKSGYLVFDSLSMQAALKQRLIDGGIFTDQIYTGSNLSQIIDILAFTFNGLVYYANRTSTDVTYTDTQLYENMNRLVKLIGYSPIGRQTSVLSFTCSATDAMSPALYTIPRYSYMNLGTNSYSFNDDVTFSKTLSNEAELLEDMSNSKLLYQGRYIEYPLYNATGDENELIYLLPGDNVIIDHFNVDVYVKGATSGTWTKWERTPSLYLASSTETKYEIRLNENKKYEIRFGNDINGQKLNTNDTVAIYYLKSDGSTGEVGVNALQGAKLTIFATNQFNEIFTDVTVNETPTIIPNEELTNLNFDNNSSSTYYSTEESVDSIRQNAPNIFRSQYRLTTEADFENYVKTNYSNLVHDVKVVNNWSYLTNYLKYFYDLGITNPNNISRVLYNQVQFADSTNFNNVYMFIVSKVAANSSNQQVYLNPSLKALIINTMQDIKLLTSEPITLDPVYMSFDIGISKTGTSADLDDINNTELYVVQKTNSKRDASAIQTDITNLFKNYFTQTNCKLGQTIDVTYLNDSILSIDGVEKFYTRRTDNGVQYEGLSMLGWNPIYVEDKKYITQNLVLLFFQFPYLNNFENFASKITVQTTRKVFEQIEY